jgi:hypothetical protein
MMIVAETACCRQFGGASFLARVKWAHGAFSHRIERAT